MITVNPKYKITAPGYRTFTRIAACLFMIVFTMTNVTYGYSEAKIYNLKPIREAESNAVGDLPARQTGLGALAQLLARQEEASRVDDAAAAELRTGYGTIMEKLNLSPEFVRDALEHDGEYFGWCAWVVEELGEYFDALADRVGIIILRDILEDSFLGFYQALDDVLAIEEGKANPQRFIKILDCLIERFGQPFIRVKFRRDYRDLTWAIRIIGDEKDGVTLEDMNKTLDWLDAQFSPADTARALYTSAEHVLHWIAHNRYHDSAAPPQHAVAHFENEWARVQRKYGTELARNMFIRLPDHFLSGGRFTFEDGIKRAKGSHTRNDRALSAALGRYILRLDAQMADSAVKMGLPGSGSYDKTGLLSPLPAGSKQKVVSPLVATTAKVTNAVKRVLPGQTFLPSRGTQVAVEPANKGAQEEIVQLAHYLLENNIVTFAWRYYEKAREAIYPLTLHVAFVMRMHNYTPKLDDRIHIAWFNRDVMDALREAAAYNASDGQ